MSALALPLLQSAQHLLLVGLEALDEVPAPEDVRPGWIAMGSFFLLFAVTILLWMNMRKQIGKIKFDDGVDRSQPTSRFPTAEPGSRSSSTEADDGGSTPPPASADSDTPRA
jgi:hypothetical protein